MMNNLSDFFATHPVFTTDEIAAFLAERGSTSPRTRSNLLQHHARRGHIVLIRRSVWAAVPPGTKPEHWSPDPYAICARLAPDAIVGYHAALALHGLAYTAWSEYAYLTAAAPRPPFEWRGMTFRPVIHPAALRRARRESAGTAVIDRGGVDVRVSTPERTLVDCLHRPELAGGWEEIWRAVDGVQYLNIGAYVDYTLLLGNATTAAKAGLLLEMHRTALGVADRDLERLETARPRAAHYLDRHTRSGGRLIARWNLIVPETMLARDWEELSGDRLGAEDFDATNDVGDDRGAATEEGI